MTTAANLIFIQSGNHNGQVTGCYGHAIVKIPTFDKLRAAEQIIFTPPPGVSSADVWAIPKQ
jgi:hypothetical protein